MNDFAANDLEAADLLALARLDDDGAPPGGDPGHWPGSSAGWPAGVRADLVIAAVADWGRACRVEHVGGRR